MIEETKQLIENMTDSDLLHVNEIESKNFFGSSVFTMKYVSFPTL